MTSLSPYPTDVIATSKSEALKRARSLTRPTIILSIDDPGKREIDFGERPDLWGVLSVRFIDDDRPGEYTMSTDDAETILDFVESYIGQYVQIIVHCYEGKSRSAGVAAALQELLFGKNDILDDWHYHPNMLCYQMIMQAGENRNWRPMGH